MTTAKRKLLLPAGFDAVTDILGLDAAGCVIIRFAGEHTAVLTPCCHAGGKGSIEADSGVVCRACYRPVPAKHGGIHAEIAVARDDLDIVLEDPRTADPERG
ncbi:hypothetical protein ACWEKT_15240 [Nocardia takedensis]